MLVHHHLVVRAEIEKPPLDEGAVSVWLSELIKNINMNVLYGPKAIYCEKEGNRGMTAFAIIDTSHIALHTWDEHKPYIIQLDVYSCAPFEKSVIWEALYEFAPTHIDYKFMDRTSNFIEVL